MGDSFRPSSNPLEEQRAIWAKCFHPSSSFIEFTKEEVEQSIPDRFEQIVRLYPDRIAIKSRNHTLTYEELNKMANRVARAILALRGPASEPIVLLLEHGAAVIVAIFGVLKAGKFYVALDPSHPRARTSYILENIQARLIVTDSQNFRLANWLIQEKITITARKGSVDAQR